VIFASLVDDPSARPDEFPTETQQQVERDRLLGLIRELVKWENSQDLAILASAHKEIVASTDGDTPVLWDPFCGGGSIPLEAQRLGLETYAGDLNPVAVLVTKALIEIPPRFENMPPVNPAVVTDRTLVDREWRGAHGLAEDVRYYGRWMRDEAQKRIGHLYPPVKVTSEMAVSRPDLTSQVGKDLPVVAYLWARTVKSPNPAFSEIGVPLVTSFVVSSKAGREAWVEPVIEDGSYRFVVRVGKLAAASAAKNGTKLSRGAHFRCVMSNAPIDPEYIKAEGRAGRMGARLMAVVVDGDRGRIYLPPSPEIECAARDAQPTWQPDTPLPDDARNFWTVNYGLDTFGSLFTPRQLVALTTFSDLVLEARDQAKTDALSAIAPKDVDSISDGGLALAQGGDGAAAYADAIAVYLACVVDRMVYYGSSLTTWLPKDSALRDCMPRQALPMTWDYAEGNPLGKSSGDVMTCVSSVSNYLDLAVAHGKASVEQRDARTSSPRSTSILFSTDPPYYDNISYADLSDYFYVWLRRALRPVFPELFSVIVVPKAEELIATPYRHGGMDEAEAFFLEGMTEAMRRLAEQASPAFPVTIYYAFKQAESNDDGGSVSTGWQTFLEAVIRAGFSITGTWPLRTEGAGRMIAKGTNALASSIVLVCRPRLTDAPTATRRDLVAALNAELPIAVAHLQRGNIAPVDLAQAAIGPGMAIYTRYAGVVDAAGKPLTVRMALELISQTLDEALSEQGGEFDSDSRWALAWFEQSGFADGDYGVAEALSTAQNTSVAGMVDAGLVVSRRGKVRLRMPAELPADWDPNSDSRLSAWEIVHQLVRALEIGGGETAAAALVAKLGTKAEAARALAYRLYALCERKKRPAEAMFYNGLVLSWPEIIHLAQQRDPSSGIQTGLFAEREE
jgi:putative DNA methylase